MTIFVLLDGMKPVEVFHTLQRAKKYAKARGIQKNGRIMEVSIIAGMFSPLFQLTTSYKFTTNWVRTSKTV